MQITYNRPADRGVTQLMYVGDDDAVDKAMQGIKTRNVLIALGLAVAALVVFSRPSSRERSASRVRQTIAGR